MCDDFVNAKQIHCSIQPLSQSNMQHAKALAILEVKDGVIQRLEHEVTAAEVEINHYEEGAALAEVREAAALSTEATIAAIEDETRHSTDMYSRSDCQMLAEMAAQAVRRAEYAAAETFELQEESRQAEHNVETAVAEMVKFASATNTTWPLSDEVARHC